ncbi:LysR family transcriptional regulator [Paenibacillus ferrarius]|uniref:LysR family transcriptional regulator n=1 Tax=Paenibacillus ferrarius TaxID=1469647 RepID=UPI003D2C3B42
MINLEWYRIFLHTAHCRNLTKAAQELHITQPSVSYAVKQMEEALGVTLFHRLSKGVELTEEGQALLAYVEQSFAMLDSGHKHLRNLKQLQEGEIRIGASDSLIKHLLLPHLNAYHSVHPGIRIRLSHGKTPELVQRLKDGDIDCAVINLPLEDAQLEVYVLDESEDCIVVGAAYRELAERVLSVPELIRLPLILLSPGSSTRRAVEHWFAAKGLTVTPDIELGNVDLLAEFAKMGYGAAWTSKAFVQEELESGSLFELRLDEPLPVRSIGFALRRDQRLSLAAVSFAEMMQQRPK